MPAKPSQIDRALKKQGLGGIDDPTLARQFAFLVKDHEHFRKILLGSPPEKRQALYETLRVEIEGIKRFVPKPLDVYMAEGADLAARKEQGQVAYEASDLDRLATDAIRKAQAIKEKKGLLKLTCRTCDREESFIGNSAVEAYAAARVDGWRVVIQLMQESVLCPRCSLASHA
jgi:hypothetical protein